MDQTSWSRPVLLPMSDDTEARLSLDGEWRVTHTPGEAFFREDGADWERVFVPGELSHPDESEYAYCREIGIPAAWAGRKILIRFDGANCLARVFVNGAFAKEHYGGFVAWDCDITPFVRAGDTARISIGMSDRPREMNSFHRGGLIRSVTLYSVPNEHVTRLHAETKWDGEYRNATLKVYLAAEGDDLSARLLLRAPDGTESPLGTVPCEKDGAAEFVVPSPAAWDSEHPRLYTLLCSLQKDGRTVERVSRRFGFREIERRGNRVYVNGQEIKLRGVNRHDTHPVLRRAITHELVEEDVRLFKEANINFIRTSHYAPRPDFLDLCDEYGIYVEDESAAFVGQNGYYTMNDPSLESRYLEPLADMIERDRSHPCVILWSLANESYWGENFARCLSYVRREDPSRLTIFSYPITMREDDGMTDVWSMHYAAWDQEPTALVDSFNRSCHEPMDIPVLHDESTHVPCYDKADQRRDPGVRDFWGETMRKFWDRLWNAEGALGCAIWAGLDDVGGRSAVPWGLIDGWRRRKPEHFLVRKAYSPIHMEGAPAADEAGNLIFRVENRFNHTDLSEVKLSWSSAGEGGEMLLPAAAPHEVALVTLPTLYRPGKRISLQFYDSMGACVDEFFWKIEDVAQPAPVPAGGCPLMQATAEDLTLEGTRFELHISRRTGMITRGAVNGRTVVTGGPHLQLTGLDLAPWALDSFSWQAEDDCAKVVIRGGYGAVKVTFTMLVDADGVMNTEYCLDDMPYPSPRKLAMRVGDDTDVGGYEEVGIAFDVPHELNTLSWKRVAPWNAYPDWHIGREEGRTPMFSGTHQSPGVEPENEWQQDEREFAAFGAYDPGCRGTVDFRSTKSCIRSSSLTGGGAGFSALSDGSDSVRMELSFAPSAIVEDTDPRVRYTGAWRHMTNANRSFSGTETWSNRAGDRAELTFTGTGVIWFGALDVIYGYARVLVDGKLMDERIHEGVIHFAEVPGKARGYEKDYRYPVYSVDGLPMGEHTITVEVTGEHHKGCFESYVVIDRFVVLREDCYGDTRFIIDNEFNYPELSWGTWVKPPIRRETGDCGRVTTKLIG